MVIDSFNHTRQATPRAGFMPTQQAPFQLPLDTLFQDPATPADSTVTPDTDPLSLHEEMAANAPAPRFVAEDKSAPSDISSKKFLEILFQDLEDRLSGLNLEAQELRDLTEEDIAFLQDKYNLTGMDSHQFRELLIDLVEMNVLSLDEALSTQFLYLGSGGVSGYLVPADDDRNNWLQWIRDRELLSWLLRIDNSHDSFADNYRYTQEQREAIEMQKRVREVLAQLIPREEYSLYSQAKAKLKEYYIL